MPSTTANSTFRAMSTFLEVVELLLTNDDAKTAYTTNPDDFLDQHGLGTFDSNDVSDAMGHAANALPLPVAAQLDPDEGLDSAAGVDLDDLGLTLEREPILDPPTAAGDLDPDDLDSDTYGEDVDFDTPDTAEQAAIDQPPGGIDELDLAPANGSETAADIVEEVVEPDTTSNDLSEELTALPLEELPTEPTLDDTNLSIDGTPDPLDDLDVDLSTDLPDDFDLLD